MCSAGDCFVVLPPNCAADTVILGRNAEDASAVGVAQEVHYYDANEALEGKTDMVGGAKALRLILQKPRPGVWGGDYGANECNVCVGLMWCDVNEAADEDGLKATDVVRYTLATAENAEAGVEQVGTLVCTHGVDNSKFSLIICDAKQVWLVSCAGKLWAAQTLKEGYHRLPRDGLAVGTVIEKSSANLAESLKTLGCWNDEGAIDFAACFNASPSSSLVWCGVEPVGDGSYSLINMFETLRLAANAANSRSATVSVLSAQGISCHWFTATPNASESVFKPFVFAPQPKISPLTKVLAGNETTLLHKLHAQRKPAALEHLRALEASCVEEVSSYLAEHPVADEELDELMKDCVEAEVKFYR